MPLFTHVLVPTDFSKPAKRAEEVAIELAEKFQASVTLLHVFWIPNSAYVTGSFAQVDALEHDAAEALEAEATSLRKRFQRLNSVLRGGNPWEEILTVAKEAGADLITMGTHGRRGLPRALLGSVAERVVHMSHVPVLTVAAAEDERDEPRETAGAPL